jgi:hypothetical protein
MHGTSAAASPPALRGYLSQLVETAGLASEKAGGYEDVFCRLAGLAVRLRFAGPALVERLVPALAHVRTELVDVPALTVRLFDSASTATEPPSAPWDDSVFHDSGKVHASIDGRVNGVFDSGTLSVYDPGSDEALYWVRAADDILAPETGSPLVTILHLWLATRGIQVAHAGAVGHSGGCVLVVGHGGAGKSSTVLACLPSELALLGEDYCLVETQDRPVAHTLFSSAKANADTIARLPFLEPMVSNPDRPEGEKALCLLADHVPEKFISTAPIRAVAIPRVTGRRDTTVTAASGAAALAALAPSTLAQLRGVGGDALSRLAGVVRTVPCHYLDAGTDPAGVAAAVRSLVDA